MYTSHHFKTAWAWAKKTCGYSFIVSTKYGLLEGAQVIEPYNASFSRSKAAGVHHTPSPGQHAAWGRRVAVQLLKRIRAHDVLVFCAGREYWKVIVPNLPPFVRVETPFKNLRLASRTKKMTLELEAAP